TLGRYKQWERTDYGHWLAGAAYDPYVDLIPPVVLDGLERRLGQWWATPLRSVAHFVLSRYVIQQHQSMSFEKTSTGSRCLLQVDGPRICATGNYEKIGITNGRFLSGMQVLVDLGLLEWDESEELYRPTKEGQQFLRQELAKETAQ